MTQTRMQNILNRLDKVKATGSGWLSLCPAHEDRNPSLSLSEGNDGRVLIHCHAGCEFDSIVDALGVSVKDLMPDNGTIGNGKVNKMNISKIYDYRN